MLGCAMGGGTHFLTIQPASLRCVNGERKGRRKKGERRKEGGLGPVYLVFPAGSLGVRGWEGGSRYEKEEGGFVRWPLFVRTCCR